MTVEETRVCTRCTDDDVLRKIMRREGKVARCSYCGSRRSSLTISDLSERVHEIIEHHFSLTRSYPLYEYPQDWSREGEPVKTVIMEVASISEAIARDVRDCLSATYGYYIMKDEGGEDPYGTDARYEEKPADDYGIYESWNFFCEDLRHRARFFSRHRQEFLDFLFSDVEHLQTYGNRPIIRAFGPGTSDTHVYRARRAMDSEHLTRIMRSPDVELGPPRGRLAKGGRMNASGISVFYGALDEVTCIAEIRPPVGSYVVTGRFELIRPLRLLDLDALTYIYETRSYFDPRYEQSAARFSFLRSLGERISRPVLPEDEEFDYLPTQAIAEYLASRRKLDGIVFHSAQTGQGGQNVVLFHEASVVEPYELPPGAEIEVHRTFEEDPDRIGRGYETIWVWETVPSEEPAAAGSDQEDVRHDKKRTVDLAALLRAPEPSASDVPIPFGAPTLRLDAQHIQVSTIRSVQYDRDSATVSRHRWTKRERNTSRF
jgi:hypothetical protein